MAHPEDDTTNRAPPPATLQVPKLEDESGAYLVVIAGTGFGNMYKLKGERTVIGRGEHATIRLVDDGISREHVALEQQGKGVVLLDLGSTNGSFCNGVRVTRQELVDGDKISLGSSTILKFTYQDHIDQTFQKQLFESALRDSLTHTFNRRYFLDRLQGELRFAVRHDKPVALLFVDVDHFKSINDGYGHQAGDHVLAEVARVLTSTIRAEDVLARYGGEEFAIICREIESAGAEALGNRLIAAVAQRKFEHAGKLIPVTVSVGAAVDPALQDAQELIAAADAAMYAAKRSGRNRVCLHGRVSAPG